jgi:hypothetical protein
MATECDNGMGYEEETIAIVNRCFGSSCADYITHKHVGGRSGKKGSRYEDLFLAYKAAEAAANQVDFPSPTWPFLVGQRLDFVDDAVLVSDSATEYYQLKNSVSVSWGSGAKSVADDFAKQFVLAQHRGEANPFTCLVVSNEGEHDLL